MTEDSEFQLEYTNLLTSYVLNSATLDVAQLVH